ncbi:arylesterase [Caulobacter sp. Root655]|uniref:alpha/beta hydrolase n=1 Tax=Caulobacter sp. Root655 TaxID=1736578 RepID=UPI0006F3CDC1|nr:alpha/beta hydrolase [Caulobacter sp. Root655]KRA56335.1 arylesterase [Caulobacter sp. Root655]
MSKTILMIHGFGAAGDSWKPVAASFTAAGYAVETPTIHASLRTVGPPPAGLAGKSLSDYVAEMSDLAQSIAKRDGAKPVVFGHSMGGLIAQKLAEAGLASGIVLFAPASPADARGKPKLSPVFTFLNIATTAKPETKAVKIWKTGFKWGVLNQTPAARHDAIFATTVHDSGRALSDLAYPDRDPDKTVHVDAAKVTVPVLVLAGARDRTTPIEDVRLVGKKYAGAEFREYPNNAHWLIDEPGSTEILAEVKTWLDAKGLGAQAPVVKPPVVKAVPADKPAATPVAAKPAVPVAPVAAPAAVPAAKPAAKAKAAPKPKPAPVKVAPAPTPAPAAEAKTPTKAALTAQAPAAAKPPAKAIAKAAPAPKAKAPAKAATPAPAPVKAPAKAKPAPAAKAPPKAATPKVAKAAPAAVAKPKVVAKAKPVAKPAAVKAPAKAVAAKPAAVAKPKAAPAAKAKPAAIAKPVVAKAPAAAKAPAKTAATKSAAKSSPAPKKSV